MKRTIISINEEKCTGCGLCIPDCPEGALQILDGKAHLVSDLFCDGLGACIGTCPEGAISVIEREAEPYDERAVMETIIQQGDAVIKAHLTHLLSHGQTTLYEQAVAFLHDRKIPVPEAGAGNSAPDPKIPVHHRFDTCPGSGARSIQRDISADADSSPCSIGSELRQWPIQLQLLHPAHPSFDDADLLISADCVPFAYGDFHRFFLQGKILVIFCPKLDPDPDGYIGKLAEIFSMHKIRSITIVHMEVPCCSGVRYIVDAALQKAGVKIQVTEQIISLEGKIIHKA